MQHRMRASPVQPAIWSRSRARDLRRAEHRHDVEQAGRGRPPGQRGAQGLRHLAELRADRLGVLAHHLLEARRRPVVDGAELAVDPGEARPSLDEQGACLVVELQRPLGIEVVGAVEELDERLGALLQARHGGEELRPQLRGEGRARGRASGPISGRIASSACDELLVGGLAHVVAVEVLELGEVEARRRAPDRGEVERLDHLLRREDLLVAVAPAEPDEVVPQRRRADSPWRGRRRRRARHAASRAWRRRRRGSAGCAPSAARSSRAPGRSASAARRW